LYNRTIICKLLISCFDLFLDYTGKKALQISTLNDMPFAWDDPASASAVAFVVQALFNGV
jgi:hypothetical protein